jgi:hypothetical protein
MSEELRFAAGLTELQRAQDIADELHAGCCQPLRSPRMEKLANTLETAYSELAQLENEPAAPSVVALLEDAGAQLGSLQVACCSPARNKLYTEALEHLSKTQRLIMRTFDLEH